jgi:hypothetical protein
VNERSRVDHFSNFGQAPVARPQLTAWSYCARYQKHNAGTQPLSPSSEQMLSCRLQNWMASAYEAAQVGQQRI